jgi:glucose-6-phosphate isomerase
VVDAVREAHRKGGVSSNLIELDNMNLYDMGKLIKFFFYAAAFSAIKFGVNPFDQPGVEVYKSEIKNNL